LERTALQGVPQRIADPAKPSIRRNIIEGDFTDVRDAAYHQDTAVVDGDRQRIIRLDAGSNIAGILLLSHRSRIFGSFP
jgi:hypothetical protein